MPDESDYARAYARDVRVDPPVSGATNVQDALGNAGAAITVGARAASLATADAVTSIVMNGATTPIAVLLAAPPAWMDSAGNIIKPGIYEGGCEVVAVGAATVPATLNTYVAVNNQAADFVAPIGPRSRIEFNGDTFPLAASDLPFACSITIYAGTDVTGTFTVQPNVTQLAQVGS